MRGVQLLRLALLAPFGLGYLWIAHAVSTSARPSAAGLLIGMLPLGVSALLLVWQSRSAWLALLGAGAVILLATELDFLCANAAWVYFIQHAGMHLLLGLMFGRTLLGPRRQALCSQVAALMLRERADAQVFDYTWRVTLAWTLYFGLTTLLSILLFRFAPVEVWSVYANLLTPLIIGAIFVIEFVIRLCVLPADRQFSIAQTIRAYREYSQRRS